MKKTKPKAIIKVEFVSNFTPDDAGKCSTEVIFSLREHPGVSVPDEVKRAVVDHIGMLCGSMLNHPDAFPEQAKPKRGRAKG